MELVGTLLAIGLSLLYGSFRLVLRWRDRRRGIGPEPVEGVSVFSGPADELHRVVAVLADVGVAAWIDGDEVHVDAAQVEDVAVLLRNRPAGGGGELPELPLDGS